MEDERYREGPVKSQEKGLVTLHRVIHCAAEITTEPSKSAFKASRGTERESHTQREQNHRKKNDDSITYWLNKNLQAAL